MLAELRSNVPQTRRLKQMGFYFVGMAFGMLSGFFLGSAYELWRQRQLSATAGKKTNPASSTERWSTLLLPPQWK
jgi:hypothetical protein